MFVYGSLHLSRFYLFTFGKVGSEMWLTKIHEKKAYQWLDDNYANQITQRLFNESVKTRQRRLQSKISAFVLENETMISITNGECLIIYNSDRRATVEAIGSQLRKFPARETRKKFEISLIIKTASGFSSIEVSIIATRLDLQRYYNDDFIVVDRLIRSGLRTKNDKGIVLLHGLPGTGKTTYLRHLVGKLRKKVFFLSPGMAEYINHPEFMEFLMKHTNIILVIKDAEAVIQSRNSGGGGAVSNILNITDGLLADFLKFQVICTFNQPIKNVDTALMRKGRLIARYEFGKLSLEKSRRLSESLGFSAPVHEEMTVAEIANRNETQQAPESSPIGFRNSSFS